MISIKRFHENGATDVVKFKSYAAFKKSPKSKAKTLKAYAIIEAVTEAILILVRILKNGK